jgi:DNA/RNA endonuclease G (NUC1)
VFLYDKYVAAISVFNEGDWARVEHYERTLAQIQTIHIIAGGVGSIGVTRGGVNEPEYFWKAIYASGQWLCWIMKNSNSSVGHDITYWKKTVAELNQLTGLRLR